MQKYDAQGRSLAARVNDAMMSGKRLNDYDLPSALKAQILNRRYSEAEINAAYAKASSKNRVAGV